jgi:alpha-glucosidase
MKRLLFLSLFIVCANTLFAQVKVTFAISANAKNTKLPKDIYIAGSFNNWDAGNKDWRLHSDDNIGWYISNFTIAPGNYEYKLTRGTWTTVECGKAGADIANRQLHLVHDTLIKLQVADWKDNYAIPEKKHTASQNVHILSENFDMPQLGRQRRVWIYLPPGYQTSQKKYPVIYMHDGQNLFDEYTSGFGEWGVDEFLDSLKAGQQQFIVVGIDHGGDFRITEYSPFDSKYGKAMGDAYARFLVETLKPYIDKHYRTYTTAAHTTIAGSSMGGLISMYAALKYPKVFGNAGIFSPAFWINTRIYDYAKAEAKPGTRYYFICGDQESEKETDDMNKMVSVLKDKGLPDKNIPATVIKGAKHNEQQWRGELPGFYEWLVRK